MNELNTTISYDKSFVNADLSCSAYDSTRGSGKDHFHLNKKLK